MGQTVRAVASSMRGVRNRPDEFTEMNNFIETFNQKINLIDKISQRIYKEERGTSGYLRLVIQIFDLFWIFTLAAVAWDVVWLTLLGFYLQIMTHALPAIENFSETGGVAQSIKCLAYAHR